MIRILLLALVLSIGSFIPAQACQKFSPSFGSRSNSMPQSIVSWHNAGTPYGQYQNHYTPRQGVQFSNYGQYRRNQTPSSFNRRFNNQRYFPY